MTLSLKCKCSDSCSFKDNCRRLHCSRFSPRYTTLTFRIIRTGALYGMKQVLTSTKSAVGLNFRIQTDFFSYRRENKNKTVSFSLIFSAAIFFPVGGSVNHFIKKVWPYYVTGYHRQTVPLNLS